MNKKKIIAFFSVLTILIASVLKLRSSRVLNLAGMIVFSAVLVSVCSIPVFGRLYDLIMDTIRKILLLPAETPQKTKRGRK